jgi:hypothetical protein
MSRIILSCSSLKDYIEAAQQKENTDIPVIYLDRKYHAEPKVMREKIIEAETELSEEVDTVLVAMGFCGGSWDEVTFPRKTVIPRVDDCITLLLQKTDKYVPNLKKPGHMYMVEMNPYDFDMEKLCTNLPKEYQVLDVEEVLHLFFDNYSYLDVVDTGLNNCYTEEYAMQAQKNADLMNVAVDYVEGSNILLEKLVGGRWDEQFLVAEAGHLIRHGDFFDF